MSKLLVVGMGPLFDEGVRQFGGQCLRTWYFVKPLLDDGHVVRLVTVPIFNPDDPTMRHAAIVRRSYQGYEYQAFTNTDFGFIHETLLQIARSFLPDALMGVNIVPAWIAARLPLCVPLWADLNGYLMAEKQGQAARTGDDKPLVDAWRKESLVARRADKFSAVSRPQLRALLGELASIGRLNQYTFHYHFAHHIPEAYLPAFAADAPSPAASPGSAEPAQRREPPPSRRPLLRGPVVPPNAFVLLWSGGYNYWTDPEFLFNFLEAVLAADDRIHFVSTGGGIEGYNCATYEEFVRRVEGSSRRARYHLLGWVPAEDLPAIYRESDLGLSIDEMNYETLFGARNRLNNLMAAGVPVITTCGSEISLMIREARCGIVCPPGDLSALVEGVLRMACRPDERWRLAERAKAFTLEEFSSEKLTAPARAWARAPHLAPDNAEKLRRQPGLSSFLDVAVNYLEETARVAQDYDVVALKKDYEDLLAIRAKSWYRTLKGIKDILLSHR